jgi:hypothetical protein
VDRELGVARLEAREQRPYNLMQAVLSARSKQVQGVQNSTRGDVNMAAKTTNIGVIKHLSRITNAASAM